MGATTGVSNREVLRAPTVLVGVIGVVLLLSLCSSASAARPHPTGLLLTLAARTCPSYTDITANKARNNIMESLRDLGPDTPYRDGENVDPDVEEAVQPNCRPLTDWRFTLGDSYTSKAVPGPWGVLSIIKGQLREPVVTKKETPLLNARGEATGKQIARGGNDRTRRRRSEARSARVPLGAGRDARPTRSSTSSSPGPEYGFGALRCATDNVNGDNVEYVAIPRRLTHVFCFAYYVKPPPTGGTIVIRKHGSAPTPRPKRSTSAATSPMSPADASPSPPRRRDRRGNLLPRRDLDQGEPWRVTEEERRLAPHRSRLHLP